jgi:hypothetical protein
MGMGGEMLWILPLTIVLLIIYRVKFPEGKNAFRSALGLLSLALILTFQNCSDESGSGLGLDSSDGDEEYLDREYCLSADGLNDPNCQETINEYCATSEGGRDPICPSNGPECTLDPYAPECVYKPGDVVYEAE